MIRQSTEGNALDEATRAQVWYALWQYLDRGQQWTDRNLFALAMAAMRAEAGVKDLDAIPTAVAYRYLRQAQAIVPLNATLYAESWERVAED